MDEDIYQVARTVRWYLPQLVGEQAGDFDAALAELLSRVAHGEDTASEIASVLSTSPALQTWAAQALGDLRLLPPELQNLEERAFEPLPGDGAPVDMERYACPDGDYVWWRVFVEDRPPVCPTHGRAVVPD